MSDTVGYISVAVAVGSVGAAYLLNRSNPQDDEGDMLADALPTAKSMLNRQAALEL